MAPKLEHKKKSEGKPEAVLPPRLDLDSRNPNTCVAARPTGVDFDLSGGANLPVQNQKYTVQNPAALKCLAHALSLNSGLLVKYLLQMKSEAELNTILLDAFNKAPEIGYKNAKIIDIEKILKQHGHIRNHNAKTSPVENVTHVQIKETPKPERVASQPHSIPVAVSKPAPEVKREIVDDLKKSEPPKARYTPPENRAWYERAMLEAKIITANPRKYVTEAIIPREPGKWNADHTVYTAKEKDTLWRVLLDERNRSTDPEIKAASIGALIAVANDQREKNPYITLPTVTTEDGNQKILNRSFDLRANDGSLLPLQPGEEINVALILDKTRIKKTQSEINLEPTEKEIDARFEENKRSKKPSEPSPATVAGRFSSAQMRTLIGEVQSALNKEHAMNSQVSIVLATAHAEKESSYKFLSVGGLGEIGLYQPLPSTAKGFFPKQFPHEIIELAKKYEKYVPAKFRALLDGLERTASKGQTHYDPKLLYNPVINTYVGQLYFAQQLEYATNDIQSKKIKYQSITSLPPAIELAARYFNGGRHGVRDWRSLGNRGTKIINNTTIYVKQLEAIVSKLEKESPQRFVAAR